MRIILIGVVEIAILLLCLSNPSIPRRCGSMSRHVVFKESNGPVLPFRLVNICGSAGSRFTRGLTTRRILSDIRRFCICTH